VGRMILMLLVICVMLGACSPAVPPKPSDAPALAGMHTLIHNDDEGLALLPTIPKLSERGINALVVEVNYNFDWKSHPELAADDGLTLQTAREVAKACRDNGIRIIPAFNCLGHQSWGERTMALLKVYPQLDETPGQYPKNKGIYCRSWCPLNPEVNPIIFDLMDELIDAFQADAFHVGMDEVMIIASDFCSRCKGKDPAELFAKAVNDYRAHLVDVNKVEMFMWGDRLINGADPATSYSKWEASFNNTYPAVDLIPKDIIICDWHYKEQESYGSIPYFLSKGFCVWPASCNEPAAASALIDYSQSYWSDPRMLGHLFTHWGLTDNQSLAKWPPLVKNFRKLR